MGFKNLGNGKAQIVNDVTGEVEAELNRCDGSACNQRGWHTGEYLLCKKCRGWAKCSGEVCQGRGYYDPNSEHAQCYRCSNPPEGWDESEPDPTRRKHDGAVLADAVRERRGDEAHPSLATFVPGDTGDFAADFRLDSDDKQAAW